MRHPRGFLCLLALPLILGGSAPAEPARKEFLLVHVRADSGSAREFRVDNRGFRVGARLGAPMARPAAVNDTLTIIGAGTVELVSADSARALSVDVWMASTYPHAPVRYTGRVVRIHRNDVLAPYYVTTP